MSKAILWMLLASPLWAGVLPGTFLPAPQPSGPVVVTGATANLAWAYSAPASVDGFNVYASTSLVFPSTPYKVVPGGTSTTTVVDRPGFGVWNFIVRAYKGTDLSAPSNTASADFQMPAPTGLTITAAMADGQTGPPGQIKFAWNTDKPSDSTVHIGDRPPLHDPALVVIHARTVTGLQRRTPYTWRLVSQTGSDVASVAGITVTK